MTRRHKELKDKFSLKGNVNLRRPLFWVVIGGLIVLQVLFTVLASSSGGYLTSLEVEIEKLTDKNRELEGSVARSASLTNLGNDYQSLGYSKPRDFIYIKSPNSFAKLP